MRTTIIATVLLQLFITNAFCSHYYSTRFEDFKHAEIVDSVVIAHYSVNDSSGKLEKCVLGGNTFNHKTILLFNSKGLKTKEVCFGVDDTIPGLIINYTYNSKGQLLRKSMPIFDPFPHIGNEEYFSYFYDEGKLAKIIHHYYSGDTSTFWEIKHNGNTQLFYINGNRLQEKETQNSYGKITHHVFYSLGGDSTVDVSTYEKDVLTGLYVYGDTYPYNVYYNYNENLTEEKVVYEEGETDYYRNYILKYQYIYDDKGNWTEMRFLNEENKVFHIVQRRIVYRII